LFKTTSILNLKTRHFRYNEIKIFNKILSIKLSPPAGNWRFESTTPCDFFYTVPLYACVGEVAIRHGAAVAHSK
jgi:hypothetical protein